MYFVFFFYRFRGAVRRKKAISDFQLIEKIQSGNSLTAIDWEVIIYILRSIKLSPENIKFKYV